MNETSHSNHSRSASDSSEPTPPTCMITGGSSGIGLATAMRFASLGYHVAICGRDEAKLASAKHAIGNSQAAGVSQTDEDDTEVLTFVADLSQTDQAVGFFEATMQRFSRVDVLVNNAGVAPLAAMESIAPETFEQLVDVNIRSSFYLTQCVWKHMLSGGGTIVNISSLSAVDPFPGFSIYGASKAWLDLMTHSLAIEGKEHGIRVCSIRPGAVETPLLRSLFPDFPPENCVAPNDIADAVVGCVQSPEAWPSGECFPVTKD